MASVTRETVYERIAHLALLDVPQKQIAQSVQLSEAMISDIINHDEKYKEIYSEKSIAHFEEQRLVNEGWDAVEALSIEGIVNTLASTHDPDFLLRAAAVANKAQRRGRFARDTINTQSMAGQVVINLNASFVDKLQQNYQISTEEQTNPVQKDSDTLSSKNLKAILADSRMQEAEKAEMGDGCGDFVLTQSEIMSLDGEDGALEDANP